MLSFFSSWLKVCLGNEALLLFQTFTPHPPASTYLSSLTRFPSLSLLSLFPPKILGSLPVLAKRGTLVAQDSIYSVFITLYGRVSSREILEGSDLILSFLRKKYL